MTKSLAWSIWTQHTVSVWPTMVTLHAMDDQEEVVLRSEEQLENLMVSRRAEVG